MFEDQQFKQKYDFSKRIAGITSTDIQISTHVFVEELQPSIISEILHQNLALTKFFISSRLHLKQVEQLTNALMSELVELEITVMAD